MNLQECYKTIGADYDDLLKRLGGSEAIASKFVKKFLNDSSYEQLLKAIEEKNWEDAFAASHTLKGIAANLSMTSLYEISSSICEDVRGGKELVDLSKVDTLKSTYNQYSQAIQNLE